MNKPWVVSVLSTDYDLRDIRKAVIESLGVTGMVPSAFETPKYPVEPDIHSHDNCIVALERSNIAILILNKRYGGIYVGSEADISITKKEFIEVVKKGIPCLIFISERTWNERHAYKKALSRSKMVKTEFDKTYICTHVDSISIIDFVEELQNINSEYECSNWIDIYRNEQDLVERVKGKLSGLTRHLLEMIVMNQKKNLEKRHTSTSFSLTIGDVFRRGYYIEPDCEVESGFLEMASDIHGKINTTLLNGYSLLILGEAGYGKTTILAKSFIEQAESFKKNKSYSIPFYLWLKKKSKDYHFDFSSYIQESFSEDCGMEPYPFLDISSVKPHFYFDAFDELCEKMDAETIERISRESMFKNPIILTCRHQYAHRYLDNYSFSDKFDTRVVVKAWNIEMANKYIENFCSIKNKNCEFAHDVHVLLTENDDIKGVLESPLLLTMMLWVIEENEMRIPVTISSRLQLFEECIIRLARRELARLQLSEGDSDKLVSAWAEASWKIYQKRMKNQKISIDSVINGLKKSYPFDLSPPYFEAIFECIGNKIVGAFHDQFFEFLLAKIFFNSCLTKSEPYPEFLESVIRPEINRYFRAMWKESDIETQQKIINSLIALYSDCLINRPKDPKTIAKRVHAVYHITRLESDVREEFLVNALDNERHISVKLSLYFGAIKMGKLDLEQRFFDLLTTDKEYNEANRGYHLAYYSDAIIGDFWPFGDDNTVNWSGTLRAFKRHFSSNDIGHYFLRRIDIITMKHLIESRECVAPLTSEMLDEFESFANIPHSEGYSEYQQKVVDAYIELKETFRVMSSDHNNE